MTARWQSGYAADCKSVYIGSIPVRASRITNHTILYLLQNPIVTGFERFPIALLSINLVH
jgi:hypothetical protein